MRKIAIILDSGSNYATTNPDIYVLPMQVFIKDNNGQEQRYWDDKNFQRSVLIEAFNNKMDVATSMTSPGLLLNMVEELKDQYEHIVIVPLSKYLTSFYNNCISLTKEYPNVTVIDGSCVGIGGNWLADQIIAYVNADKDIHKLQAYIDSLITKTCGVVIVGDLNQLKKGGRISAFKCMMASAFKIKLIVKFDGKLTYVAKDLSWTGAIDKSLALIDNQIKYSSQHIAHISVMNELNNQDEGDKLVAYTMSKIKDPVTNEPSLLPKCVIAHTGINSFSILIQTK